MEKKERVLGPYRVLDLTDEKGMFCGKILADLGADVIKIERPGGDIARNIGPFYHEERSPEKSLYFLALNLGKRGITLDISKPEGQAIFKKMVRNADIVVESYTPGYLNDFGLGYDQLSEINPKVILTSVSWFGQTGPYSRNQGSDIVAMGMGGYLYLCGHRDRPPVRFSFPQSFFVASGDAAGGSLVALYARNLYGYGQHVDVSIQESVSMILSEAAEYWDLNRVNVVREGSGRRRPTTGVIIPEIYPCKNGYVSFVMMGGPVGARTNRRLAELMNDEFLLSINWEALDYGTMSQEEHDKLIAPMREFFLAHTKEELYSEALRRRFMLFPVSTIADLLDNPQLKARGFWPEIEYSYLNTFITHPGAFAKFSETHIDIHRRAPLVGEHNKEIYSEELKLSEEEITSLKEKVII